MKKLSLLGVLFLAFFTQLSAQIDKKDTLIVKDRISNTTTLERLKTYGEIDQLSKSLVLLDGKVYTNNLDSINNQNIKSISVMSGFWGANHYGKAGENGVIIIKLKKDTLAKKL